MRTVASTENPLFSQASMSAAGTKTSSVTHACGKAATAETTVASEVRLDIDEQARRAAKIEPALVLDGVAPRLIDEWQVVPAMWNHVRRAVDVRRRPGQFILTVSAVPADDVTRHTGAGQLTRVRMRPMTQFESGVTNGSVSLAAVLDGAAPRASAPDLTIRQLAELVALGGWTANLGKSPAATLAAVRDYVEEIRHTDVSRVDGVRRDPVRVGRLLRSLGRNESTYVSAATGPSWQARSTAAASKASRGLGAGATGWVVMGARRVVGAVPGLRVN
jgi:hypothetical protein